MPIDSVGISRDRASVLRLAFRPTSGTQGTTTTEREAGPDISLKALTSSLTSKVQPSCTTAKDLARLIRWEG